MDINKLIDQLNQLGEQETIEAKRAEHIGKSILETVCAYANEPNLGGGYLLLGIDELETQDGFSYHVVGVTNAEKLITDLASQCRTKFNTPLQVNIQQQIINGKTIISVFVPEVSHSIKPIYFKNQGLPQGAFRRIGSSDVRCTEDDLILLYQNREIETFDYSIIEDSRWDDFDLDAVNDYRRERAEVHPNAEELHWTDNELLQSLGCLKRINNESKLTAAGVLLFGKKAAIRRLFPTMRVEYIREPGKKWMSDIENRYIAMEIRAPILTAIRKTLSAIMDDLPMAFSLPEGSLQREDIPIIPYAVIREAVVNSIMHRSYRANQPIQIIRYANRIEIRNPGYSLIAEEHLGEPGSKSRNPKIAETLHETRFAEMKGSGIRIMRKKMQQAGLTPPLFESNRGRDLFTATFLFHHFLSDGDLDWLASFKEYNLSDDQAKALIFVREVGAIDNSAYRNLNQVDTLTASSSLRLLRDLGLLESKNQSTATYYIPGQKFIDSLNNEFQSEGNKPELDSKRQVSESKRQVLEGKRQVPEGKRQVSEQGELSAELPRECQELLDNLGGKAPREAVERAILALCKWKEMTSDELASLLRRKDKARLIRDYLSPMIKKKLLVYKYPMMQKHPNQAYRTK